MTQNERDRCDLQGGEGLALRPLRFRSMVVRNRVIRDSWEPAFDWERKFAQAGVGAIISPPYSVLDLPREHIERIHSYLCKYIVRIRQESSPRQVLTTTEIGHVIQSLAKEAQQARDLGADGVEIDGSGGTVIARFMGHGPSDRPAAYQGPVGRRCLLAREIVRAVRDSVDPDFHVQIRLGASSPLGMMAAGTLQLIRWLKEDGIDAVHLTAGDVPGAQTERSMEVAARYIKGITDLPVLLSGSFRTPGAILTALREGACDAVTLKRPLIASSRAVAMRPRLIA